MAPESSRSQTTQPVITSIRPEGTNITVAVSVPAGIRRVTLESRVRLGAGGWAPVAVRQRDGTGGTVTFRLPRTRQLELLRVRADAHQALPGTFYAGTNSFLGPPTNALASLSRFGACDTLAGGISPTESGTRDVVESDIWKLGGDRLYFFNQYRGLQVIDITNPDAATVLGTLDLPAAGEQMYLLGSNHVVLLARNGCAYNADGSQVLVVAVAKGLPQVVAKLPVEGLIQESRLVGTALYAASQTYRPVSGTTNSTWEWGTLVSSFDLANPDLPTARSTLWYAGYGNVVTATDTYLFVVTQDPGKLWQSIVRLIDITAPDGTMALFASIRTAGRVMDKFKLNYAGEVFTSISEDWHAGNGTVLATRLETFRLPDPRSGPPGAIVKLGELQLGNGQRLHATRFDGKLAYVVTFFRIDPLWVVDLSDPVKPHIAGELEVPGWSTYIQPLGNRLVAVGVETNHVAVSLFDVHDPARPALLSKVRLGQNYSWSEANNDEKAFTVLTDIGLILVPYSGDTTNGWTSRIQLIDLNPSSLVARGIIERQFQPRRATFSHNRILSLSGWELLSVDATERDKPIVRGETELAWSVDQLFLQGSFLLELATSTGWWGGQNPPTVRVAPADRPNEVVGGMSLGNLPIVGASVKDGRLYLAQRGAYSYRLLWGGDPGHTNGPPTNAPNFFVTVIDLRSLPKLAIKGQVSVAAELSNWGARWEAAWPKPDVLVWVGGGVNYWWWDRGMLPLLGNPGGRIGIWGMVWPGWGFGGGGQLLAFDVSRPADPKFASEVNLTTNNWWSFSKPFTTGNLVYLSHSASEFVPDGVSGTWRQRSFLDVIDYADPLTPTVRNPVVIPGTLQGISHQGELLYTVGTHWTTHQTVDWTDWLDASAYDGVAAHLVASLPLPEAWPRPVLAVGPSLFLGRLGYNYKDTNVVAHRLETWTLPDNGKFTLQGSVTLGAPASTLIERGGLLAVQETDNSVDLFDDSAPGALLRIGRKEAPGCLGFDLNPADGTVLRGLWIPFGVYGVGQVNRGP